MRFSNLDLARQKSISSYPQSSDSLNHPTPDQTKTAQAPPPLPSNLNSKRTVGPISHRTTFHLLASTPRDDGTVLVSH